MEETKLEAWELCDICKHNKLTDHSVPNQGISCVGCGKALCDDCYHLSVKLYGFVGDKNLIFPKPSEPSKTCMEWPYNEYYPEDFGCFKMTRGCIECMTTSPPKRDKFGNFIKGDNYAIGENYLTRVIQETKNGKPIPKDYLHSL